MSKETKNIAKEVVVEKPLLLRGEPWMDIIWDLFCPGCQIPLVGRLVAESLEELGIGDKAIMVGCVGCTGILIAGLTMDRVSPAHGRGPDIATALKRIHPDTVVLTFSLVAPIFLYGIFTSQRLMLLPVLIILAGFYGLYFWKRKTMVARFELQQLTRQAANERVKRGLDRWMKLYHCSRDDVVFEPGKNQFVPTDQMTGYLLKE